jgi:hypothetical protein
VRCNPTHHPLSRVALSSPLHYGTETVPSAVCSGSCQMVLRRSKPDAGVKSCQLALGCCHVRRLQRTSALQPHTPPIVSCCSFASILRRFLDCVFSDSQRLVKEFQRHQNLAAVAKCCQLAVGSCHVRRLPRTNALQMHPPPPFLLAAPLFSFSDRSNSALSLLCGASSQRVPPVAMCCHLAPL